MTIKPLPKLAWRLLVCGALASCGAAERPTTLATPHDANAPAQRAPVDALPLEKMSTTALTPLEIDIAIGGSVCFDPAAGANSLVLTDPVVPQGVVRASSSNVLRGGQLVSNRERAAR